MIKESNIRMLAPPQPIQRRLKLQVKCAVE